MNSFEKRFAGPDRVVGAEKDTENKLKSMAKKQIQTDQTPLVNERIKTPEEIEIISDILNRLPDFVNEYGATQERPIHTDQIHILDHQNNETRKIKSNFETNVIGGYSPSESRIEILSHKSNIKMGHVLVHELIHANSFLSVTLRKDGEGTTENPLASLRRFGFVISKEGTVNQAWFKYLNEATTEELTKRFCTKFFPEIRLLKKEFLLHRSAEKASEEPNDPPLASLMNEAIISNPLYVYFDERAVFITLVELLYKKNPKKFETYEDVFKLFSKAMLQGNLLPPARLIEQTLGKGTFRKIGEKTQYAAEDSIKSLHDTYKNLSSENTKKNTS